LQEEGLRLGIEAIEGIQATEVFLGLDTQSGLGLLLGTSSRLPRCLSHLIIELYEGTYTLLAIEGRVSVNLTLFMKLFAARQA